MVLFCDKRDGNCGDCCETFKNCLFQSSVVSFLNYSLRSLGVCHQRTGFCPTGFLDFNVFFFFFQVKWFIQTGFSTSFIVVSQKYSDYQKNCPFSRLKYSREIFTVFFFFGLFFKSLLVVPNCKWRMLFFLSMRLKRNYPDMFI